MASLLGLSACGFWTATSAVSGLELLAGSSLALGLAHLLGLGSVLVLGFLWSAARPWDLFSLHWPGARSLAALLAGMAGVSILGSEAANLLLLASGTAGVTGPGLAGIEGVESSLAATLLVVCGIVPWTEELLFRGFVLDGLRARLREQSACLASAVLFSAFHLNLLQVPLTLAAGWLLARWRVRTGSLLACVIGHAGLNGFPFLVTALWGPVRGYGFETDPSLLQPAGFDLVGAALVWIGLLGLRQGRVGRRG